MFLENSADFYATWIGFSKLGIVTAWINSNLKLDPLAHSINVAGQCTAVITSKSLYPNLKSASSKNLFKRPLRIYSVDTIDDGQTSVIELPKLINDISEPKPSGKVTFKGKILHNIQNRPIFRCSLLHLHKRHNWQSKTGSYQTLSILFCHHGQWSRFRSN